jgi:hypothetical protein
MDCDTLNEALRLNSMGISTIPLAPGQKIPPRGFRWKQFQNRLPTACELKDWHDGTEFGLAAICGGVSGGLYALDFDKPGSYERFRGRHTDICRSLPAVSTGRGVHLWARSPTTQTKKFSWGELRGDGCYVAAPPSIHPSGRSYRWFRPLTELPTVDLSLIVGSRSRVPSPALEDSSLTLPHPFILLCDTYTVEQAIEATLPPHIGTRNSSLLRFCQLLRRLFPDATPKQVEAHVREWHRRALPTIRTQDYRTTWREFYAAFPETTGGTLGPTWREATSTAESVSVPAWAERYGDGYQTVIRMAIALNQEHGGGSFPLACRQVERFTGINYKTASRMLAKLVDDRVLARTSTEVVPGVKAFEYRYIGMDREVVT